MHTSHSDTHCPTLGQYSRIHPSSGSVRLFCARQHFTTSRSVLRTHVHWRMNMLLAHGPGSGSASSSSYFHCSSSSLWTTIHLQKFEYWFSKISLDPFRYSSKPTKALKLINFYSQTTAPFPFSTFRSPTPNSPQIANFWSFISQLQKLLKRHKQTFKQHNNTRHLNGNAEF